MVRCLEPVKEFVHTITVDNGKVSEELCAGFYFATPYHSWERGLNEHTSGLVREFFAKSQDLREAEPREVKRVEELLNARPRRVLDYRRPAEVFCEAVGGKSSVVSELCSWRE